MLILDIVVDWVLFHDQFVSSRNRHAVLGDEETRDRANDSGEAALFALDEHSAQRLGQRARIVLGGVSQVLRSLVT